MVYTATKVEVMKKVILSLMLASLMATSFCQQKTMEVKDKDYYLQKSKDKKTVAWVLLGAGTAAVIGGAIGFNQTFCIFCEDDGSSSAYAFLMLGGVVADLASIPFFISASHYKKIAADISIGNQNSYMMKQNYLVLNKIPVLIVRIHLP
jgi:hypothetical protein